jgi:hypothetical protein
MRKSREEAAETRARIIRKASKEFNQHGIAGTGLADVMKSAGLTHGGFYKLLEAVSDGAILAGPLGTRLPLVDDGEVAPLR